MIHTEISGLFTEEILRASGTADAADSLLLVPPISGFTPALQERRSALAAAAQTRFASVRAVEFAGQNGRPGSFSVRRSADALACLLREERELQFVLFGMCSGAAACVDAATRVGNVSRLLLWEMSPRYAYNRRTRSYFERRFHVSFCEQTFLAPIQPVELVGSLRCETIFAMASPSIYCNDSGQEELASNTALGMRCVVAGATHFLDGEGTVAALAQMLDGSRSKQT